MEGAGPVDPAGVTPATIRYLFADRWMNPDDTGWGVRLPAGTKGSGLVLASNLLTISIWSLAQGGLVTARQVGESNGPKLFGRFEVTTLGGKSATRAQVIDATASRPGLEGALLEASENGEDMATRQWVLNLGLASGSPWNTVINACRDEAVAAGLIRVEGRLRKRPVIADRSALSALEGENDRIGAARQDYRERNPDLDEAIFHDCWKALEWAHQSTS